MRKRCLSLLSLACKATAGGAKHILRIAASSAMMWAKMSSLLVPCDWSGILKTSTEPSQQPTCDTAEPCLHSTFIQHRKGILASCLPQSTLTAWETRHDKRRTAEDYETEPVNIMAQMFHSIHDCEGSNLGVGVGVMCLLDSAERF